MGVAIYNKPRAEALTLTDITGTSLTLTGLTATRMLATDGDKKLASVANLASWIAGTSNRVTVTDDTDGTITLTGPQDLATASTPTFGGLTLGASGATVGSVAAGANVTVNATEGSELAPSIIADNWTVGAGWAAVVGGVLDKTGDGTGTAAPTAAITAVAGTTYRVTVTLSALTAGSFDIAIGGTSYYSITSTTTVCLKAGATANLTISPSSASRFTISAISCKALTDATGDATVYGDITGDRVFVRQGVAGYPSISCVTDTNTGFFFSGLDGLNIVTGGSTSLSISTTSVSIDRAVRLTSVSAPTAATDRFWIYSADVLGVAGKAGPHLMGETGGILAVRPELGTTVLFSYQKDDLADDASVSLPDATDGMVFVSCNAEAGMWLVQADGTCTKISGSTNTVATDTDANLCVFDGGTSATVRNRLGAVGVTRIAYFYN